MIEQLEAIALKSVALKDMEYFHRKICRYYSNHFHTPLLEVYDLPWPFVFTNYLEHILETNHGQEGIYDLAIDICYPEKRIDDEYHLQQRITEIEAEEEAKRQAIKDRANPPKETSSEDEPDIEMKSISFEHLEDEMEEEEK